MTKQGTEREPSCFVKILLFPTCKYYIRLWSMKYIKHREYPVKITSQPHGTFSLQDGNNCKGTPFHVIPVYRKVEEVHNTALLMLIAQFLMCMCNMAFVSCGRELPFYSAQTNRLTP